MAEQKSAPFTNPRNKITIYKITAIYAVFYILMKLYAIFIEGSWLLPNLILCIPMLIIGLIAWKQLKQDNTSWWFILISIIVVSALRYYEVEWVLWLNQKI
jgi:lysylphosphatidylglycerol synthetase-like protein (DUF2156 family)